MTLLLLEGFSWTSAPADLVADGWTAIPALSASGPRFTGSNSVSGAAAAGTIQFGKTFGSVTTGGTLIFGVAIKVASVGLASRDLVAPVAAVSGVAKLVLTLTNTNHIAVRDAVSGGGTLIGTGTATFAANVWKYIECKVFINGASSTVEVHADGSADIASTTFTFSGTLPLTAFEFFGPTSNIPSYTDLYVCDGTGAVNNDFLGNVQVETRVPNADGNYQQFAPNSGSAHYSRVNEVGPDDDTSYNSDATVGHRDSYTMNPLTALSGSIYGVKTRVRLRKDETGARQAAAFYRSGGVNYDRATRTLSVGYQTFQEIMETDPSTSAAWTVAGVNSAEVGVKVVA